MHEFPSDFPTICVCRKLRKKSLFSELFGFWVEKKYRSASQTWLLLCKDLAPQILSTAFASTLRLDLPEPQQWILRVLI